MRRDRVLATAALALFVAAGLIADALAPEPPSPDEPIAGVSGFAETVIERSAPAIEQSDLTVDAPPPAPPQTYIGEFTTYGYCKCAKCCGKWADVPSPEKVPGVCVAADPDVLPRGTRIYIEGVGERVVMDTGGGINGNTLDVLYPDHDTALEHGKPRLKVWVVEATK